MPTKHIAARTWKRVEEKMVEAVIVNKKPIKDAQVLDLIINKGLEVISQEELKKLGE